MRDKEEALVERVGRHYEAEGLPRIAGRVFGFLLLQEEPCSLDGLAGALAVSKTSVSTNARMLEQLGLIHRVTKPGDRKDYYEAAPNQARTLEFRLEGLREMGSILDEVTELIRKDRPQARQRVDEMRRFNDEGLSVLSDLLERWRSK